jgi:uncharacterized RDD family membrane protein YckC
MDERTPRPAGFWIRFAAFGIDLFVVMLAQFLLGLIAGRRWGVDAERSLAFQGGVMLFTFLFAVLYPTVLHSLAGQTIGKLVLGVRAVATDGELLPFGAALLRALAHWLSLSFLFGLGHVLAGLRKDKRALHDLLAGSRVERLPAAGATARRPPPEPADAVPSLKPL